MGFGAAGEGQHSWTLDEEHSREIIKRGIALTPYSALASGRLSRKPGEDSRRLQQDSYAKFKYDATREQDEVIIRRVQEIAEKRNITMTEISFAWLLTKAASPVAGATKFLHIEGAQKR